MLAVVIMAGSRGPGALAMDRPSSPQGSFKIIPVEETDVPVTYTPPGSVVSDGDIGVSSRVVGFIQQLEVREGQKVSRGDLLVRIEPRRVWRRRFRLNQAAMAA
ncbi:multidrug efflux pump subunit AcrA (membrane-fusion protein) [Rhodoblastus acidophilus]|uniref:biotin/lipoyl-binding protein n=1 Tax=Rhodoblastus acidophilus TaxID=1074 RepID=UPI00222575CD|nr:biotin/lipoyl-binding protein [Rhodoblastus acidophilus]MCW2319067.1 multidrug efflux pump subunit AcrA (membrane-fusion protein) [Rhodoblastus acidophilus]